MKKLKNFYYRFKEPFDKSFSRVSLMILCCVPYYFYEGGDYWIWGKENYSLVFVSIAGIMKAVVDTLDFHYDKSIFASQSKFYWNPEFSWKNKYNDQYVRLKWFNLIPVPVVLTDAWHLFQSFQINLIILAIVTYKPTYTMLIDFVVLSFLYRAFFFLFYKYFLIKK